MTGLVKMQGKEEKNRNLLMMSGKCKRKEETKKRKGEIIGFVIHQMLEES